jgi:hypothetical protein
MYAINSLSTKSIELLHMKLLAVPALACPKLTAYVSICIDGICDHHCRSIWFSSRTLDLGRGWAKGIQNRFYH